MNGTLQFKNKRFIISEMIEGQRKVKDILEQNENYLMVIALWTRLLSREKEREKKNQEQVNLIQIVSTEANKTCMCE